MKHGMIIPITRRAQLAAAAAELAADLQPGDHLGLIGPLGAGKTTFIQSLAAALHCPTVPDSPTFTLRHTYQCQTPTGPVRLVHVDLYRLAGIEAVRELGLDDDFRAPATLVIVEWADRAPDLIRRLRYLLTFAWDTQTDRRTLTIDRVQSF